MTRRSLRLPFRNAVPLFCLLCQPLSPSLRAGQEPDITFRASTHDVQVTPQVLRDGNPVNGLQAADFVIYDNGTPQKAVYFGRESTPLNLVLLLDVSGSVRKYLPDIANVATSALQKLGPEDRVSVMIFSRNAVENQPFTTNPQQVADAIAGATRQQPPGSGTRIHSSILTAASSLEQEETKEFRRRAILIVTDNSGITYAMPQKRVLQELFRSNVLLSAIVVGRHPRPPQAEPGMSLNPDFIYDDVFPLAEQTGGDVVVTTKPRASLADLLERIRNRYVLLYPAPEAAEPGSFRSIRVTLAPAAAKRYARVAIQCRTGYYVADRPEN